MCSLIHSDWHAWFWRCGGQHQLLAANRRWLENPKKNWLITGDLKIKNRSSQSQVSWKKKKVLAMCDFTYVLSHHSFWLCNLSYAKATWRSSFVSTWKMKRGDQLSKYKSKLNLKYLKWQEQLTIQLDALKQRTCWLVISIFVNCCILHVSFWGVSDSRVLLYFQLIVGSIPWIKQ